MRIKIALTGCMLAFTTACVPEAKVETPTTQDQQFRIEEFLRGSHAFIFTRDVENTTGALAIFDIDQQKYEADGLGKGTWVSNNIAFKSDGSLLYVIDKTGANISIIDPETPKKPLRQFSVGAGTNPEDFVRIDGKGYVTRYDSTEVLIINPDSGTQLGTVDLSEFSTAVDPYPEMSAAITADGKIWIAVQRLDRNFWGPSTDGTTGLVTGSYIVGIDPKTDKITSRIKTTNTNPVQLINDPLDGSLLVLAGRDYWNNPTPSSKGGIEKINLKTGTSEVIVDGDDYPNGLGYAAATTSSIYFQTIDSVDLDTAWNNHIGSESSIIYRIDRKTGAKKEIVRSSEGFLALSCLELSPTGVLVVCSGPGQRVTKPGLRLFDPATGKELTEAPIKSELPPFGVAFFARPATAVVPVEVVVH